MSASTGAARAALGLKAAGVERVFALCGDHVNALFHAVAAAGIEVVGTRHESAAVQMADGWARATGRPGVAIVTAGPGHTNAVTGAAVAAGAQSPVLVISGQAPRARRERGGNQSLHQAALMRPVTKWAIEAEDAAGLDELVARALLVAAAPTPGPVSLSIPVDLAEARLPSGLRPPEPVRAAAASDRVPARDVREIAERLARARRPVLVLGGNAWSLGETRAVVAAAHRLGMPVFTNGHARGVVADDGRLCYGHANALFNALFDQARDADCLVLAGTGADYSLGSGARRLVADDAWVVQVHPDPAQIGVGRLPGDAIVGEVAAVLAALAAALDRPRAAQRWAAWHRRLRARWAARTRYWNELRRAHAGRASPGGFHPVAVCAALQPHWTPNTSLVFDVGDFSNWPKASFPAVAHAHYMDGGALGNLGGALAVGLGVQFARPAAPVWTFIGDGGFGFHGWELSVAVEHRLPIKLIVGNDRAWGTEKRLQLAGFGGEVACDLPAIRYDRFAELLGARGFHAGPQDDLQAVVDAFVAAEGPCVLDVDVLQLAGRPYQPAARAPGA